MSSWLPLETPSHPPRVTVLPAPPSPTVAAPAPPATATPPPPPAPSATAAAATTTVTNKIDYMNSLNESICFQGNVMFSFVF